MTKPIASTTVVIATIFFMCKPQARLILIDPTVYFIVAAAVNNHSILACETPLIEGEDAGMSEREFQEFEVEAMLSRFEQTVEYNYSESGVHPARLDEIIDENQLQELYHTEMNYPEVNGNATLRRLIATLYDGASEDNVLVTVGAAEANYLLVNTLVSAGDNIAVMSPYCRQVWGIAKNIGANVSTFSLRHDEWWP